MKAKCLILFLLISTITQSQQLHLSGNVVDAQTNLPIALATINIKSKNLDFPTNNEGKFDITNDEIKNTDSIRFSCLGYQTKTLKAADLSSNIIIRLNVVIKMLAEVNINSSGLPVIKTGYDGKQKSGDCWTPTEHSDLAMFMAGSKGVKGNIQTISFYLTNGSGMFKGGDVTAPFRVRIFAVDSDGTPGEELTKKMIIVRAKKSRAWFDVDISAYHITNPDSGFYASFSLLPQEYYQLRYSRCYYGDDYQTHEEVNPGDMYAPRLGVIAHETRVTRSYLSVDSDAYNMSWHWIKDYYNWEYMIRASIAP